MMPIFFSIIVGQANGGSDADADVDADAIFSLTSFRRTLPWGKLERTYDVGAHFALASTLVGSVESDTIKAAITHLDTAGNLYRWRDNNPTWASQCFQRAMVGRAAGDCAVLCCRSVSRAMSTQANRREMMRKGKHPKNSTHTSALNAAALLFL